MSHFHVWEFFSSVLFYRTLNPSKETLPHHAHMRHTPHKLSRFSPAQDYTGLPKLGLSSMQTLTTTTLSRVRFTSWLKFTPKERAANSFHLAPLNQPPQTTLPRKSQARLPFSGFVPSTTRHLTKGKPTFIKHFHTISKPRRALEQQQSLKQTRFKFKPPRFVLCPLFLVFPCPNSQQANITWETRRHYLLH